MHEAVLVEDERSAQGHDVPLARIVEVVDPVHDVLRELWVLDVQDCELCLVVKAILHAQERDGHLALGVGVST